MRAFVIAVFAFLYLPIALVVLFSFNAGRHASEFTGFSVQWYGKALSNPFLVEALKNSLFIATTSALLAAVFGTAAALGLARVGVRTRAVFDATAGCGDRRSGRRHRHLDAGRARPAVRGRQSVPRLDLAGRSAAHGCRSAMVRSSPRMACSRWRW